MPNAPHADQNTKLTRAQVALLVVVIGYLWVASILEFTAPFRR